MSQFLSIPTQTYKLGWRNDILAPITLSTIPDEYLERYSKSRSIEIKTFSINQRTISLEDYIEEDVDFDDLEALCDFLDAKLKPAGLRLPTEDEWEVAMGMGQRAFPWGDELRNDILAPITLEGIVFNSNTYEIELTRSALKLGDGGEAICGCYPWPAAWMSLAVSHRMNDESIADCFYEFLEEATFRTVKL